MEFDFEYFKPHPDPDKKGYVVHDRYCTYQEFYDALCNHLKSIPFDDEYTVYNHLDYISCAAGWEEMKKEIPKFRWIYCWFTRGGSEGFYFHVESAYFKEQNNLFIAKTLSENLDTALKINNEICKFIINTMDK